MQTASPVAHERNYQLWENTFQQLSFEIKAGHDLHQMVLTFAYLDRLHLHKLGSRWPQLSWLAISRGAQVMVGLSAVYAVALIVFLALDGVSLWAKSLDQQHYSEGAPPSDLQQHHDYAQAQRDAGLLFGLFPLLILLVGATTSWLCDRRQLLAGYRHFQRATRLGDYTQTNTQRLAHELTAHIEFLLTRRYEPGCQAVANLLINLQQMWVDERALLGSTDQSTGFSDASASTSHTHLTIPRAEFVNFLLYATLKKMSHPLINTPVDQRYEFLRTLVEDNYFQLQANQAKLGLLLVDFFKAPEPTADVSATQSYAANLAAYRRLGDNHKKTVLTVLLTQITTGEAVSRVLLTQKETPRFHDRLMQHFIYLGKPKAVRLHLECQNYQMLPDKDSDIISTLLKV